MNLSANIAQKISFPELSMPLLEYVQIHCNNNAAPLRHRRELLKIYDAQVLYRVFYENESNEYPDYIVTIGQRKTEAFLEVIENSARKDLFTEGIRFENIAISRRRFWFLRMKLCFVGIWSLRSRMSNLLGYPYLHCYEFVTEYKYNFFISDGFMKRYRLAKANVLFYDFFERIQLRYPHKILGRFLYNIDMPVEIAGEIESKETSRIFLLPIGVFSFIYGCMYSDFSVLNTFNILISLLVIVFLVYNWDND